MNDFNVLLHDLRSRELARMPGGARVVLSGGCAGSWYFDWFRANYPTPVERHLGIELQGAPPEELPDEVEWLELSLADLTPVVDGEVDLVFAGQVLEHLWPHEVADFLLEAHRVLRLGGRLVLDSPNRRVTSALGWTQPEHTIEFYRRGWLAVEEYERYGVLMAREAISRSRLFAVHSRYAAQLARLDAAGDDKAKVRVIPFGYPEATLDRQDDGLATYGVVRPIKQTERIVSAFGDVLKARPDAVLGIIGPLPEDEGASLHEIAEQRGFADRLRLTGYLEPKRLQAWVARTTIAVQLRAASNGESAASVADCLAAGIPTIITALGAARELPDDSVVKVDRDIGEDALAREIVTLLDDAGRRRSLTRAGNLYAREHSFAKAARAILDELVLVRASSQAA